MKLFRSLVLFAVAGLVGGAAFAQNPATFAGVANAYAYAYGVNPRVPALQVDMPSTPSLAGVATLSLAYGNIALSDGTVLAPLATNAPITIGIGANRETVTPTAVSCSTPQIYQSCTFTATFTYQHGTGDPVSTGTFGLAEAVNKQFSLGGGVVIINRDFIRAGGAISTVTSTLGYLVVPIVQNIGTASGSAFSYKSTGTSGSPAAYAVTTISWY